MQAGRIAAAAGVVVVAGAIAALAAPRHSTADSDAAFASGSFQISYPALNEATDHVSFTGHIKPNGEAAGTIVIHTTQEPFFFKADVTCTVVVGNTARVGGVFREPVTFEGSTVYAAALQLQDNGPPGQAVDMADDYVLLARPGRDDQTPCLIPLPPAARPVEQGNIVIDGQEGSRLIR